jgi:hypothetical protein
MIDIYVNYYLGHVTFAMTYKSRPVTLVLLRLVFISAAIITVMVPISTWPTFEGDRLEASVLPGWEQIPQAFLKHLGKGLLLPLPKGP